MVRRCCCIDLYVLQEVVYTVSQSVAIYTYMSYNRLCSGTANKLPAGSAFKRQGAPGCTQVQGLPVSLIKIVCTEQSVLIVFSTGDFGQDADSPGTCVQPGGDANPQLSKALEHVTTPCQSLA